MAVMLMKVTPHNSRVKTMVFKRFLFFVSPPPLFPFLGTNQLCGVAQKAPQVKHQVNNVAVKLNAASNSVRTTERPFFVEIIKMIRAPQFPE